MADTSQQASLTKPAWQIGLRRGGSTTDLSPSLAQRLISLTINDERGIDSDDITLTLDDQDNKLALPPTGALLAVSIGWAGQPLVNKGTYTVDEMDYEGVPRKLVLRGRGAVVGGDLKTKKERSWHEKTLGDIANKIAGEHALRANVSAALASIAIPHIDQTSESDVNFLTRLTQRYDAIATVKSGTLLIMPAGKSTSASGAPLKAITITAGQCDSFRYHSADRGKYTGVIAYWYDINGCERQTVLVGSNEQTQTLRESYSSAAEAWAAATSELKRITRGKATLALKLSKGIAALMPESSVTTTGFKREIDDTPWVVVKVAHSLDEKGYTADVELECK